MAERTGGEGTLNEGNTTGRSGRMEMPYVATGRTAPRASHESRIGTDEAHERLQAARNRARRSAEDISLDDVSADH